MSWLPIQKKSVGFDSETLVAISRKNELLLCVCDWVRNPSSDNIFLGHLFINEQEEFMELQADRTLKLKFSEIELAHF